MPTKKNAILDPQELLRRRIRGRARSWFGAEMLLHGRSTAMQCLESALEIAPDGWPLVIVAEAGSGVSNWLFALHIAATEEPQPLRLLHAKQWLRDQGMTESLAAGETLAFSRLDLLDAVQLITFGQWLESSYRVIASARPEPEESLERGGSATRRFRNAGFATVISLPPLRERPEDVPPILRYFLKRYGFPQPLELASSVIDKCLAYTWPGNEVQLSRFVARLVAEVDETTVGLEQLAVVAPQILKSSTPALHPALQRAVRFVNDNYQRPRSFTQVAEASFTSTSHLSYLFKKDLKTRFSSFLAQVRVRHAQRMIRGNPERPLELLAEHCGFTSLRQMERHFQKQVGCSPSAWRQRM